MRGFNRGNRASYMALERYEGTSIAESLEASDVTVDPETGRWHAQRYILRHITPDGEETFEQRRDLDTLINLDVRELGRVRQDHLDDEDRRVERLSCGSSAPRVRVRST